MWRKLVSELEEGCRFEAPASDQQIDDAEKKLEVRFPKSLRELLTETDGILGNDFSRLIQNIQDILSTNLEFRSEPHFTEYYMPFDSLLFFGDAGNGDYFAFPIVKGIARDDVFTWNHEDDSRTWVAPSLEKYLEWWLKGIIKI